MKTILLLFLIVLMFQIILTVPYTIKYLKCNAADVISKNYSCVVHNNVVSGYGWLNTVIGRSAENKLLTQAKLYKLIHKVWHTWLIDVEMDACDGADFLFKPNSNLYIDIIRPEIKKYTNVNHTCPFGPNELFYMKNLDINRVLSEKAAYFLKGAYKFEVKSFLTAFDKLCIHVVGEIEITSILKSRIKKHKLKQQL